MAARARELEKSIAPIKDKLKAFIKARLDTVANADKITAAHASLMDVLGTERTALCVSPCALFTGFKFGCDSNGIPFLPFFC